MSESFALSAITRANAYAFRAQLARIAGDELTERVFEWLARQAYMSAEWEAWK